ncbi:MAG: DUF3788 domain-containing protein [Chloroflexi bacterium]|nr:DUF3788 domain-containing protein [Chloroflexota bacterium]
MSIGAFTDKTRQPTEAEIQAAIGTQLSAWRDLLRFIRENYSPDEDFKFLYGKKYGWALRFRMGGQLLTSLYPAAGGFTVQVNLSPAAVERAQQMGLGESAQAAIAWATPYPEGRWLFIPVQAAGDVGDIQKLLALRVEAKGLREAR